MARGRELTGKTQRPGLCRWEAYCQERCLGCICSFNVISFYFCVCLFLFFVFLTLTHLFYFLNFVFQLLQKSISMKLEGKRTCVHIRVSTTPRQQRFPPCPCPFPVRTVLEPYRSCGRVEVTLDLRSLYLSVPQFPYPKRKSVIIVPFSGGCADYVSQHL